MKGLEDRRVIVIGGASGIGRAASVRFGELGSKVAVIDIDTEGSKRTVADAQAAGAPVAAGFEADVTDMDGLGAAIGRACDALGGLDSLVNAVGWNEHSYFTQQEPDFWERVLAVNLKGQIYAARLAIDRMLPQQGGSIVTVSSDAGRVGTNGETVYSAAKAGVIALTKSLAREVSRFGIRINCVAPGPTDTPELAKAQEAQPGLVDKMTGLIPMKRIGQPEEPAEAIVFLASDSAGYITGQVLSVNGGLTMVG